MADLKATWKPGFRKSNVLDAVKVHQEFEKLRSKNNGELRTDDIVEAARSKRSPLHKGFTWDDAVAGERLRKIEAARIVRSIEVVRPESPETGATRAYEVSRSQVEPKEKSYRSIGDIMNDPEAKAELLNRALGELLAVRRRYSRLQELAIVFREIDNVLTTYKPS